MELFEYRSGKDKKNLRLECDRLVEGSFASVVKNIRSTNRKILGSTPIGSNWSSFYPSMPACVIH